jgi:hypothetical protein
MNIYVLQASRVVEECVEHIGRFPKEGYIGIVQQRPGAALEIEAAQHKFEGVHGNLMEFNGG